MTRKYLFLASEVRSGSTYVAETVAYSLEKTLGLQLFQLAEEKLSFSHEETSVSEVTCAIESLYLDRSGYAATKIMCAALSLLHNRAKFCEHLSEILYGKNTVWIIVRRKDKIRQAVSLAYSRKSGVYHHYDKERPAGDEGLRPTNFEISSALDAIIRSDLILEMFGRKVKSKVEFFYEDFRADPLSHLRVIYDACGFSFPEDVASVQALCKLIPTAQSEKSSSAEDFSAWLLDNYASPLTNANTD